MTGHQRRRTGRPGRRVGGSGSRGHGSGSGGRGSGSGGHGSEAGAAPGAATDRPFAEIIDQARRTVGAGALAVAVVIVATLFVALVWPLLSLTFSSARPVVDELYSSSVYVGSGVQDIDRQEISGIIGTRLLAVVVLAADDDLAGDPGDTCRAVVEQLPDLIAQVVVDGRARYGCEGSDVEYGGGIDRTQWDIRFWLQQDYATALAKGDVPEIARSLALAYDAEVQGDRLVGSTREFDSPPPRMWMAAGIAGGVIVGTAALYFLLRWGIRRGFAAADRRREWEDQRDRIDSELGEIAMAIMAVDPAEGDQRRAAAAVGEVAADYRAALIDLDRWRAGEPLKPLAERVHGIHRRLRSAGVR